MATPQHVRLVHDYYRAVDAGDVEDALVPFDDDCNYHRQGFDVIRGAEALRHFYSSRRVIEVGEHRLDQVLASEEWVAVRGGFACVLKTGESVELQFTDWFRFRDLRIVYRQSLFPSRAV